MPIDELHDGVGTKIEFTTDSSFSIRETEIEVPSIDGGGAIDVTSLRNTKWKTKAAKTLLSLGDISFSGFWKPAGHLTAPVNKEQLIVITIPGFGTLKFWGFLDKWKPGKMADGEATNVEGTIVPTLRDPSTGLEVSPLFTAIA